MPAASTETTTRILVVDDEPEVVEFFCAVLQAKGYEVLRAWTGREALGVVREQQPDLVLLDVVLPDIRGTEVCRQIKSDPALKNVFVVLVSGEASNVVAEPARPAVAADDFIVKPMSQEEFLARIRTIVRLRDANAALRASEQFYRRLVEILPDAVVLVSLQGRVLGVNPKAVELLRYKQSAGLLDASIFDLVPAHCHERLRADTHRIIRAGSFAGLEYPLLRQDGSAVEAELSGALLHDPAGRVAGALVVARDITQRRRIEEEVRLMADAVQSTAELICITDLANRFIFANRAFLQAYGYTLEELLGQKPDMLYAAGNRPGLCEHIYQQTLRRRWEGEVLNRRKDGSEFPVALATSQIRGGDGRILGLVGVARDITDLKRTERQSRAFSQLGHRLSIAMSPRQAAEIILEIASDLFGWDAAYLQLYSAAEDKVIPVLLVDTIGGARVPIEHHNITPTPMMRQVLKEGGKLVERGGGGEPGVSLRPFGDTGRVSQSIMVVPVRSRQAALGVLSIQSYTPRKYSQGDLLLLQGLADHCGDALSRIAAVEALATAEAKFRSIFEQATEGIFQMTPAGAYRSANPALARMLGCDSPEELIRGGANMARRLFVHPRQRAELKRMLDTQGVAQNFEVECRRKDGSKVWLSINAHVVRGAGGAPAYYEGTAQDTTSRKRTQEALLESQRLQRALLDNMPDPAWMKDLEGRFLACNEALGRFYGRSPESVVGVTSFDLNPENASQVQREDEEVMHRRKPLLMEAKRVDGSGRVRWVEVYKSPLFDADGRIVGTVGVSRDITERKRVADELRRFPRRIIEAQETERTRVARELHDGVNQLIASAQMRLTRVEEGLAASRPAAAEIVARCRDLLVEALEENRRIAHNLRPSELDQLGLTMATRNLCRQLKARAGISVSCHITRLEGRLSPAVELNIFRIVQEALTNAEKHARAKRIKVAIATADGALVVTVEDDGQGFDLEEIRRSRRKTRRIGLTSIRERAAVLEGTCQIDSRPGQGTRIRVTVPHPGR